MSSLYVLSNLQDLQKPSPTHNSDSAFISFFKQYTGTTPAQYFKSSGV